MGISAAAGEASPRALIGHPMGTKKSPANANAPARITLQLSAALPNCGRTAGNHSSRISLEIRYDRVYEPYGKSDTFP
jgi:hypothetical protein